MSNLFMPLRSMRRYNADVQRCLDVVHAGVSQDDRQQMQEMWNAQTNENGEDLVRIYVRDSRNMKLIDSFLIPLEATATQISQAREKEVMRIRRLHPHLEQFMTICHE